MALSPSLGHIEESIAEYDRRIVQIAKEVYPEVFRDEACHSL